MDRTFLGLTVYGPVVRGLKTPEQTPKREVAKVQATLASGNVFVMDMDALRGFYGPTLTNSAVFTHFDD